MHFTTLAQNDTRSLLNALDALDVNRSTDALDARR